MAYNPNNLNGQATSANSQPIVIASNQSTLPITATDTTSSGTLGALNQTVVLSTIGQSSASVTITGTWVGVITFEGTVDGTTWDSINAIAATTSQPQATTTVNGLYRLTPGSLMQIRANMTLYTSGTVSISMRGSLASAGVFLNHIAPTKITDGTNTVAIKAPSTAAVASDPSAVMALSPNTPLPTGGNTIGRVTQQVITKGTQGTSGVTTQDLKDSGRSARNIILDSYSVVGTAETLMTMSYSADNGTLTTGTSYNVTVGKRFRIQSISAGLHTITGNTTAINVIVRIRANNVGVGIVTSPVQLVIPVQGTASTNQAITPVQIAIPDGWEFVAGAGIAVTTSCSGFVATTAAPKVDITIIGYEY